MKKIFLLIILIHSCFKATYSQPGELDPSFGAKGIVTTGIGATYNYNFDNSSVGRQVLFQPGAGIFVVVNAAILNGTVIAKRLANGSPDLNYGNKGFSASVPINDPHAAPQPDGKIVVVGWTNTHFISAVSLARYNTDGSLDPTFKRFASEIIDFGLNLSIAIQSNGKIVVAGYATNDEGDTNFALARFNADGTLDRSFGEGGKQFTGFGLKLPPDRGGSYPESDYATSLAIQQDGKIVAAGYAFNYATLTYDFAIAKYNSNGTLDKTFDHDGKQTTSFGNADDYINSVAIQKNGKIVAAGSSGGDFAVARYNANGNLDKTFSRDGLQTTDFGLSDDVGYSVTIQSNGKIVVSGYTFNGSNNDFALVRYNSNGSLDNTLNGNGKQTKNFGSSDDYANSVAIQSDGKIVIEGYTSDGSHSNFNLARFNINGSEDYSFNGLGGLNETPKQGYTDYTCIAVQKDGKIVAGGYSWNGKNFDFALARYNTNGSLDNTFSTDGKQMTDFASSDDQANAIAIQNDGKIVLAGVSNSDFVVARYNSDGSLDISFNRIGKQITDFASSDDEASSVAIQSNGKIIIAGRSNMDFAIARYNSDGSLDRSFNRNGKQTTDFNSSDDYAYSVAVQPDGKIVAAGRTLSVDDNTSLFALARYKTDGSLDPVFGNDGKQASSFGYMYNFAYSVAIQNDGKILAAGYAGDPALFALARFKEDGSPDSTLSDDGMETTDFGFDYSIAKSIAIGGNGKILLAGYVWKENGLNFGLASYNENGKLDTDFSGDGLQITDASDGDNFINGIAVANNKLYAAGTGRYPGDLGVVAAYLLKESIPPSVNISIPGNVVKFTSPASVKINATATDKDGTIDKVEFYNGTTLLHTEKVTPYGFLWKNVSAGTYTLIAKATDNSGNVTESNRITITVKEPNAAPTVNITKPANYATYNWFATIHFEANAKDNDGRITRVDFYNGSTLLKTEYEFPYTYNWKNVSAGTHIITAVATDDMGAHTTSAPLTVKVVVPHPISGIWSTILDDKIRLIGGLGLTLYPNPATNSINIYAHGLQLTGPVTISVLSTTGVVVRMQESNTASKTIQVDVTSLLRGVYIIKLTQGDKVFYKQFVKL